MIYHGDLFDVLPTLPADSIDACVTDPPYELGFMGKKWDATGIANDPKTWRAVYRVLKPGAHLAAFSASRTHHRMMCAIEDAGFEIRDCLMWLYGQGFPKSLDVSKAIDKEAGRTRTDRRVADYGANAVFQPTSTVLDKGTPVTAAAAQWQGWGTALKPAYEPIILARKPFDGTVAANVQQHGTGALNIDGCRLDPRGTVQIAGPSSGPSTECPGGYGYKGAGGKEYAADLGRWPANVLLDEEAAEVLDRLSDERPARFFYTAKPSRSERDDGLEGFAEKTAGELTDRKDGAAGTSHPRAGAGRETGIGALRDGGRGNGGRNVHPTVKPIALMHWLIKLITPPDGVVLDPFCGSGTTGMGARWGGFQFIGVEKEAEYAAIAERRINAANPLFHEEEQTIVLPRAAVGAAQPEAASAMPSRPASLLPPASAQKRPSALTFLDALRRPEEPARAAEPAGEGEAPAQTPEPAMEPSGRLEDLSRGSALELKIDLEARGHRLLTRDGRFFVSEASRLTQGDRDAIKRFRDELIAMAMPWQETPLTVGSLFAGIGGFDLGFQRAGYIIRWQVEIDPFCRKVLAKHWPNVKRYDDVRTVGSNLERVDVICGGFPCQDISLQGDGAGLAGERSGLWREFHRIIDLLRPRYVLLENVAALLGRGIDRVLGDLASIGYDAEWECLEASAFGAPHTRNRIWLVAYPRGNGIQGVFQGSIPRLAEFSWFENVRRIEDLRERSELPPSLIRGSGDGIPDWMDRLSGCGNAVIPGIVEWIAKRIAVCAGQARSVSISTAAGTR